MGVGLPSERHHEKSQVGGAAGCRSIPAENHSPLVFTTFRPR